jgi:hypothetical protein
MQRILALQKLEVAEIAAEAAAGSCTSSWSDCCKPPPTENDG